MLFSLLSGMQFRLEGSIREDKINKTVFYSGKLLLPCQTHLLDIFICNELPIIHADKNFQSSFLCGTQVLYSRLSGSSLRTSKQTQTQLLMWNGWPLFVCLLLKKLYFSFIFCQEWSKPEVTWNKWHSSELGVLACFLQQSWLVVYYTGTVRINQFDDQVFQETAVTCLDLSDLLERQNSRPCLSIVKLSKIGIWKRPDVSLLIERKGQGFKW